MQFQHLLTSFLVYLIIESLSCSSKQPATFLHPIYFNLLIDCTISCNCNFYLHGMPMNSSGLVLKCFCLYSSDWWAVCFNVSQEGPRLPVYSNTWNMPVEYTLIQYPSFNIYFSVHNLRQVTALHTATLGTWWKEKFFTQAGIVPYPSPWYIQ